MKALKSDHSFGSWMTVRESTVDVPGLEERSCFECGYREQREIPIIVPTSPFTNVFENSTPHYEDILWLAEHGIDTSFPDLVFRPCNDMVRCDMVAFLHRLIIHTDIQE